ncbi:hypothetical protein STEG23_028368, partial [Scotinomys teguina]
MARKVGQWEEEEVAQSHEEEERQQPAMKRKCRVTANYNRSDWKDGFKQDCIHLRKESPVYSIEEELHMREQMDRKHILVVMTQLSAM